MTWLKNLIDLRMVRTYHPVHAMVRSSKYCWYYHEQCFCLNHLFYNNDCLLNYRGNSYLVFNFITWSNFTDSDVQTVKKYRKT